MGKQILFHMLLEDCQEFVQFLAERDPVVITQRDSDTPEVIPLGIAACNQTQCSSRRGQLLSPPLVLWNAVLVPHLDRKRVRPSKPYYTIESSLPVLEMAVSERCEWNGREALTQGRIWSSFESTSKSFNAWFKAIGEWIRRRYRPNPVGFLKGYVAPRAMQWHNRGGVASADVDSGGWPRL